MSEDIFLSLLRDADGKGIVFEVDGETAYLYLCTSNPTQILGAIHIWSENPRLTGNDYSLKLSHDEHWGALFIKGDLWAAFKLDTGQPVGGDYTPFNSPKLFPDIPTSSFDQKH